MRNASCELCPLHKEVKSVCVYGEAVGKRPKLMLIGEAPGDNEDAQARPFVGRAGQVLRRTMQELGIDSYYLTNVVKCQPPDNRVPKLDEQRACSKYLDEEIKHVKPERIVLLGSTAIRAFTTELRPAVHAYRGRRAWVHDGISLMATWHPAYVLRDPSHLEEFVHDLDQAYRLAAEAPKEFAIIHKSLVQSVSSVVALDIETTGYNPFDSNGRILCAAWSQGKNTWTTDNIPSLVRALNSKTPTLIGHNVKFDLLWLRQKFGYRHYGPIFDTYVMIHLLDEEGQKGLKYLSGVLTDLGNYAGDILGARNEQRLGEVWDSDRNAVLLYNAYDTQATWRVYQALYPRIKAEGLEALCMMQMRLLPVVVDMEARGVEVNRSEAKKQATEIDSQIKRMDKLLALAEKDLNPDSPKQIVELIQKWQVPIPKMTPKGQPSVDEESLLEILDGSKLPKPHKAILQTIVDRRALKKLKSTYIDGVLEVLDEGGVVHPSFNPCGTVTGRFGTSNPNVQNIPRGSPVSKIYQAREGYVFIAADYSQLELRIAAHLSGDEGLIGVFKSGMDLHSYTASRLGIERSMAKTINFGIFYGMGPKKLSRTLKIPMKNASAIIRSWFQSYPAVQLWLERMEKMLLDTGYVVSPFGRRRRLPATVEKDRMKYVHMIRQACNFPVQSTGADLTMMAMVLVHERYPVISNVHDSIIVEVPIRQEQKAKKAMKEIMEDPKLTHSFGFKIPWRVPFEVQIRSGENWFDMKEEADAKKEIRNR